MTNNKANSTHRRTIEALTAKYASVIELSNGSVGVAGMALQTRALDAYRAADTDDEKLEAETMYADAHALQRMEFGTPPARDA